MLYRTHDEESKESNLPESEKARYSGTVVPNFEVQNEPEKAGKRRRWKTIVDEFVDVKAPSFNAFHQGTTRMPQLIQSQALKIHTFSTDFNKD